MVLLAGGAGYIGSHMAVELLNLGFEVAIADNFANSSPEVCNRIKKITGRGFRFFELDVCDESLLSRVFESHKIDCIVHFAGHKAAGESAALPIKYYRNNLGCTLALCAMMQRYGAGRLIFSSSACVYDEGNPMPLGEDGKTGACANPYGYTKHMSEQILKCGAAANKDWSVVSLRYFNLLGAHGSGEIGDDPTGIPRNLPPFVAQTAAGKHKELVVFGADYPTPDGSCIRDYIHVSDLVRGHVAAMDYAGKARGFEAFNLGTGKGTSVFEFVRAFGEATGIEIPVRIAGRRPGDAAVSYCSPEKAARVLGWKAEKTIADGCRDMWKWQSRNPDGYTAGA